MTPNIQVKGYWVPCPLCLAVENEEHLAYFTSDNEMGDGDWFYILPTKNKKGHELRFQVVNKEHGSIAPGCWDIPTPKVPQDGINLLFQFMLKFKKDFTIMEPTHASIPEHWHVVASTLDSGDDDAQIVDTDRIEIRFKGREKQ